jgi:hypothetical protein
LPGVRSPEQERTRRASQGRSPRFIVVKSVAPDAAVNSLGRTTPIVE